MSVRVKIILTNIFKDYRKEAFLLLKAADQSFHYVRDFEKHIQKIFNIQFGIYLTIGESLLPSYEDISVIHSGDTIIVNKLNDKRISNDELNNKQSLDDQSNDESNLLKRGKRIRKRRKKQVDRKDVKDNDLSPVKIAEPTFTVHQSIIRSTNSHIRFSNATTTELPSMDNEGVPPKCVDVLQARVIRPVTILSVADARSSLRSGSPTPNILLCNAQKRGVVSLKDLTNDCNYAEIAASIDFGEIIKSIDNHMNFVPLTGEEPKAYDLIAFKMLKIGKNYEPQLSEWIIAMVKDIEDPNIVLHILAGVGETACPDGKLSMTICEETESSPIITLKREDLLNVKVFYNK